MKLNKPLLALGTALLALSLSAHSQAKLIDSKTIEMLNGDEGSKYDLESAKAIKKRKDELIQEINEEYDASIVTTCKYEVETEHVTVCPYSGSAMVMNPFTNEMVRRIGGEVTKTYKISTLASQWNRPPRKMWMPIDIDEFNFYASGNPKECDYTPFYHQTSTVFYRFVNGNIAESKRVYFQAQYYLLVDKPNPESEVISARLLMCNNPGSGGPIF